MESPGIFGQDRSATRVADRCGAGILPKEQLLLERPLFENGRFTHILSRKIKIKDCCLS